MKKSMFLLISVIVVSAMLLAGCKPAEPTVAENPGLQMDSAKVAPQYFNDADYAESLDLMSKSALNPEAPIYLQYLVENPTDISKYP
ncbi:MAG: hypothetical protein MUO40_05960, partial [Anaerolineaceae bacterium]|nr:hypothetical protein [Anaerolineaceae bacterium]